MRKIILFLLVLPIVANAQKVSTTQKESEKKTIKYEDFISKNGVVCTTYTYPIDDIELVWNTSTSTFKDKLSFHIEKMIVGNTSVSFLNISHNKYDGASSVMIEETNVKDLCSALNKIKEISKKQVPEGARAEYTYLNNDGIYIYFSGDLWKIKLEKFDKDTIYASDIDPLINKLQEIMQKMASI